MNVVKKSIVLFLLLAVTHVAVFSQAAVAKLKYEEAEEAYAAADYSTALEKLDEVEKMLGETNPRILYLRITACYKVMKAQKYIDLEAVTALRKNCRNYLVKYENVQGIEEKYKEIYKISEAIKYFNTEEQLFAQLQKGVGTAADYVKAGEAYDVVNNGAKALDYYQRAADKGSAEAMYFIALCYFNAFGVKKDTIAANQWLSKAVAAGSAGAWYVRGSQYKNATAGYAQSDAKFRECVNKSVELATPEAQKGNAYMMYILGRTLAYGETGDSLKGVEWIAKAADKGYVDALEYMSSFYRYGTFVSKDVAKGIKYLQKAVERGSAAAMYSMGYTYYRGDMGSVDYNKAVEWFNRAADYGNGSAPYMLGYMYAEGKGVSKDVTTAINWYTLATERGNVYAPNSLGFIYYYGNMVAQDMGKAVKWYLIAAERGHLPAFNNAANTYYKGGPGLAQNYQKAAEWYLKGAAAGSHWCYYNYGNMLYNGDGMTVNYEKAAGFYTKAAAMNNTDAMDKLYGMYYNGTGVKKDKKLAQEYADRSAALKARD